MKNQNVLRHVVEVSVSSIQSSKFPLRRFYDEEALRELGDSISEIGGIYPIVVRPASRKGFFELIIGSRRLKSAQKRKETTIEAVVLSGIDDKQSMVLALAENLKRADLTPFEEAAGFLTLLKDLKMSEKELARRVSCTEQFIRQRLKLLSLSPQVQEMILEKKLGLDKIDVLANLPEKKQLRYAQTAVRHSLTDDEFSLLAARDPKNPSAKLRRRTSEGFTGKRVGLKIDAFSQWLKDSETSILEMSRKDRQLVRESLDALIGVADKIAKNPSVAGQASDLARAMDKIHRIRPAS